MNQFKKIAIANRGEVAVRIIHACQELGIETVLLHSDADVTSRAYRLCDQAICIGGAPVGESYLNIQAMIAGAQAAGADALHPGFGFLSENADFARACSENKIIFIGPSADAIGTLGDKIRAKSLARELAIPTIPGYQGDNQDTETLLKQAEIIGFPVVVKAAAGGGGRGMKILRSSTDASSLIESAQRESENAFGSRKVFLEKYFEQAKHIEVQVFGDASGKVYPLFERECSVQRRHQKIIEEALSPSLTASLREKILAASVQLAEKANYKSAGTVEFLVQDGQFYFLEMNTRLQVEHPVTEMVLGIDLVKAQIMTAQGAPLDWPKNFSPRGHAIECRIYAEDAFSIGIPSVGLLGSCHWPEGPGRRFEVGFEKGDTISSHYDSMIAKVIVWDETRPRAIQKMLRVLHDSIVFGVKTNMPFLRQILLHPDFLLGTMTTRFIENHFPGGLPLSAEDNGEKRCNQHRIFWS